MSQSRGDAPPNDAKSPDTLRALASKRLESGFVSFEEQDWHKLRAHADAWAEQWHQQTERVEALVGYVTVLGLNCEKQSVLLMVHGNSDPWAESRRVFDALPEDVKELLRAALAAGKEKP